jgi:uncharacterized membrane protein (UPF0127 family)
MRMVGLLALLFLACLGSPGCQWPPSGNSSRPQNGATATNSAAPEVVFYPSVGGAPVQVRVELARTPQEQARGLMFRRSLDTDAGMLFLFDRPEIRRFWMRNCYIPLDMLFLDANRLVVGVEENTIPGDETGRGPDTPAQYVVEVAGGYARSHGLGLGSRVEFHNVN